jgi:protein O-mannosyl-transferase
MYLKLALWPWPLVLHYEFDYLTTFAAAWPYVVTVTLLALLTIALVLRRTAAGFALTWVVAILSPTLVVPIITEIAAERRMYLPLAALIALAVGGGYTLLQRFFAGQTSAARTLSGHRPLLITCAAGLIVAFIYGDVGAQRLAEFNDPLLIWQGALQHQPRSSISQFNMGITLSTRGRPQEAIPHFEEAIRLKPDDGGTHNNLGFALMLVGRNDEAIHHIEEAIRLKPDSAEAQNNMGLALGNAGRPAEAIPHLRQAMSLKPEYADAAVNLGVCLGRAGQPAEAVEQLRQALIWSPDHLDAFAPLLNAYMDIGKEAEAIATAQQGMQAARAQGRSDLANQFAAWLNEHRPVKTSP